MSVLCETIILALHENYLVPSTTYAGVQGEDGAVQLCFALPPDYLNLETTIVAISDGWS